LPCRTDTPFGFPFDFAQGFGKTGRLCPSSLILILISSHTRFLNPPHFESGRASRRAAKPGKHQLLDWLLEKAIACSGVDEAVYHRPMDGNLIAVTAFILAGGKSTRMGTDKAFMTLNGRSLLERMLDLGRSVTPDVRIIGNAQKFAPFAPTVEDVFRDCGPLGGIHAALRASSSELNLILAVDLPFVSPALLQYLITRAQSAPAASATVPDAAGGWQPLCAVYRREFADAAESALRAGRYKIDELFDVVQTQRIEEGELASAGLSPELFQNLNTREEVKAATEKLEVPSESQLSDDSRPQHPYVEFRDVSKAFGDNVVLNHVSFDVLPSETVCVLGRSGVGKSVALHHIMGFLKPDSGRVLVAGEDITDYTEEQLEAIRKKVTMVFQNGALFDSLTVGENVAFPLRESRDLSEEQIYQIVDGLLHMVACRRCATCCPRTFPPG